MNKRLFTVAEMAEYIGSTTKSIYTQVHTKAIPSRLIVRINRSLRFDKEEVDKWIETLKSPI